MKIYLDTCCYGRPHDDRTQPTIDAEAVAVMTAVEFCHIVGYDIIGGETVTTELAKIRNADKRRDIEIFFYDSIDKYFAVTANEAARAATLQAHGLGVMDSYHLATAEAAGVDVLLTTDRDFLKISERINTTVKVINPLSFLSEATK